MLVKLLDQQHPSRDGAELCRQRALYEGGERWQALVPWWLPQHPEEAEETYAHRKKRALYENHAGPIVGMLAASVFTEAPTVELQGAASWLDGFVGNVDGAGTALASWFEERLVDALVQRTAYVWVNLPARPEGPAPASIADSDSARLSPSRQPMSASKSSRAAVRRRFSACTSLDRSICSQGTGSLPGKVVGVATPP